jgi:Ubiquitin 3 binding protein But2 C-terminal domain
MRFTTTTISTIALLGFTSAIPTPNPTPAELTPRACTTIQPSYISYFEKANPTTSTSGFGQYRLARTGGTNSNTAKSVFRFDNITAGATGCMLQFQLGAGREHASGANDASLFTVKGQVGDNTNWNNQPVKDTQVSSLQFPTTRAPDAYETIAYASTCPAGGSVSFLLEESDWQQNAGSIAFMQGQASGFSMIYNC